MKWAPEETVQFVEFCTFFYPLIGEEWKNGVTKNLREKQKLRCLKELLEVMQDGQRVVTLKNFGRVLAGFGPLAREKDSKTTILDRIYEVLKSEWFHGDISNEESTRLLTSHQQTGEYLVRMSWSDGFPFTIAKVNKNKTITLQRIGFHQKEYFVRTKSEVLSHSSLPHLIEKHGKALGLTKICPRNKYTQIFQNELEFVGYDAYDDDDEGIVKHLEEHYGRKVHL